MKLISLNDFAAATGLKKWGKFGIVVSFILMHIFRIPKINRIYKRIGHLEGQEFIDELMKILGHKYIVHEEDLKRIPADGPFIIVSNHPLGTLDGILLIKLVGSIRPDFRVMANFLLTYIKPIAPYIIPVNPFETRKSAFNSFNGIKTALMHLKSGGCMALFPAGEVSKVNKETGKVQDKEWEIASIKLIKKARVPVIPVYFHSKNSRLFYSLGRLHPNLQTLLLPHEMVRRRLKPLQFRISKPIPPKELQTKETIQELSDFLRMKVYLMESFYEKSKPIIDNIIQNAKSLAPGKKYKEIIPETKLEKILEEIRKLRNQPEALLYHSNQYEIYFAESSKIPNILREIGRLREITFRMIGEGTGNAYDLDKYDQHYNHLFLWDSDKERIVGAYRMLLGSKVYDKMGIKAFYTSSLFDFDKETHPFFRKVIEMGRAFVCPDYQQKPLPLFLLWRGIAHVCIRNPEHKFLLGGVSISDKFSDFSKSLMVEFMRSNYYDPFVAQYVHPKNEFKVRLKVSDKELLIDPLHDDINKFDKLIDEIEPSNLRLPVLIKKYIKQNAKVIAFNVDPKFNDAIDGLMYIRISDIPEETMKPVMEEIQREIEQQKNH